MNKQSFGLGREKVSHSNTRRSFCCNLIPYASTPFACEPPTPLHLPVAALAVRREAPMHSLLWWVSVLLVVRSATAGRCVKRIHATALTEPVMLEAISKMQALVVEQGGLPRGWLEEARASPEIQGARTKGAGSLHGVSLVRARGELPSGLPLFLRDSFSFRPQTIWTADPSGRGRGTLDPAGTMHVDSVGSAAAAAAAAAAALQFPACHT